MAELEDIVDLPGFGPSKIDSFRTAGYNSLEDLRGITWDELGEVKGIKSSAKRRAILNFLEEHGLRKKPETEKKYEKFRSLLEELFQFESADLDFGVYRIMNEKRDRIEEFLDKELQQKVQTELEEFQATEQGEAQERLEAAKEQIKNDFPHWIDENGNVGDEALPEDVQGIAKERKDEYLKAKAEAEKAEIGENVEAAIYQDLYRFFKRYYEDGDFIPQRRAANQEKYAIPYNGEEVKLHWANKNQYFVKTGEKFKDYKFRIEGTPYEINFKLHNAHIEKNNKKGDEKYFILRNKAPVEQDERLLTVHFEYRPLTEEDYEKYSLSESSQSSTYKKEIRKQTEEKILSKVSNRLEEILNQDVENPNSDSTVLQKHLKNYKTKNENDYFIHKDLGGFLEQELDFYLKNEVFSWKEMTDRTGEMPTHVRARLNAIENIAKEIINFVAEIEDYQKKLFEKKKFVVNTEYCITLDKIPDELYPKILENEEQIEDWKDLYALEEQDQEVITRFTGDHEIDESFLNSHPGLIIDTRNFSEEFKYELLSSFDEISEERNGLLIKGENFQALRLIKENYENRVDSVYIDPPYNTGENDFVFKDDFQDSSWLSMMKDRLDLGFDLMKDSGALLCHIDEHEMSELHRLFAENYGEDDNLGEIVWNKRNPKGDSRAVATQHEYIFSWTNNLDEFKPANNFVKLKENAEEMKKKAGDLFKRVQQEEIYLEEANSKYQDWIKNNDNLSGGERAYKYIDREGKIYRPTSMAWPNKNDPDEDYKSNIEHPKTGKDCKKPKRGWRFPSDSLEEMKEGEVIERGDHIIKGEIIFGKDHTTVPNRKTLLEENVVENLPSIISYGGSADKTFSALDLEFDDNPKPLEISEKLLEPALKLSDTEHSLENPLVLDYFAGSGTAGDTAIQLGREFEKDINYILVEMGDHFEKVLLPRIKKRVFSSEWKNGIPQDEESTPHFIQYHKLESYDDTLDNLDAGDDQTGVEDFTSNSLEYFLNFEVEGESLLDLDDLKDPFNYEMYIREGDEAKKETIDLIETFNYLLGLEVQGIQQLENNDRKYRIVTGEKDNEKVTVIWRPIEDDDGKEFFEEDREFLRSNVLGDGDIVYINYDSALSNAKSIENTFQNRMWE